jgi:hypothetical protein
MIEVPNSASDIEDWFCAPRQVRGESERSQETRLPEATDKVVAQISLKCLSAAVEV